MKRFFLSAILISSLPPLESFAQRTIDVSKMDMPTNAFFCVSGEPFINAKFVRLTEGSPYFKDEWLSAVGTAANGSRYAARQVKLDLFDNEIHYLDSSGREMVTNAPLKQLLLSDSASGETYHFVHASSLPAPATKNGWYRLLAQGKATLYSYPQKLVSESRPYGSSTSEQRIATRTGYYLATPTHLQPVKNTKELVALLTDKKPELEAWLQTKTSKRQSAEEQLTALVMYYNDLQD